MTGLSAIEGYRKATQVGKLSAELRAQIAWTCARQDRAAYALGHAAARLREIGYTADRCFALDNLADQPVATRAALALAVKLTTKPQMITDQDIAAVRQHFGDHETAEIVHHITQAAFFDRLTEATNLPLEFDPF